MPVTPFRKAATHSDGMRVRLSTIEQRLAQLVPSETSWPAQLHSAERHALLSPGKRFRPLLCLLVAEGCQGEASNALDVACVSEMVHAASLILDDLPCMDDADLRRNRPTVHVAYSESTAILSATALLNRAYGVLMRAPITAEHRVELGEMLSYAVGSKGLIAGQIADLANEDMTASEAEVERLNTLKTGALFDFAIDAGALVGGALPAQRMALRDFSQVLGLAFQLLDDLLDTSTASGKSAFRDDGKATLVALSGESGARERLQSYKSDLLEALGRADLSTQTEIAGIMDVYFDLAKP